MTARCSPSRTRMGLTGIMLTYNDGNEKVVLTKTCARMLEYPQRMCVCSFYLNSS